MKVKLKGMYPKNRTIPEENRGRSFDIATINAGVQLNDDGLTIVISKTDIASSLKNYFDLRKFKGISKHKISADKKIGD